MAAHPPFERFRLGCRADERLFGGLRRRLVRTRLDAHAHLLLGLVEDDGAVDEGEQGVVPAHADILAAMELSAALPHQDVAGQPVLAAELLHAEAAPFRIAAVARAAACLFMSHVPRAPKLAGDAGDLEDREVLAMTVLAPGILAPPLLEDDDLV